MGTKNFLLTVLASTLLLPAGGFAQQSLGDLARELREQRAKSEKKPAKVFTNDNLPARPPEEGRTAAAGMSSTPKTEAPAAETPSTAAPEKEQPKTPEKPKEDKKKTRDFWQGRYKAAREALAQVQEIQQVAEDELNLLQIQQARELDPNIKSDLDNRVNAKKADVDSDRAATEKAKKALSDLEKEFEESGAPADWSKTD